MHCQKNIKLDYDLLKTVVYVCVCVCVCVCLLFCMLFSTRDSELVWRRIFVGNVS